MIYLVTNQIRSDYQVITVEQSLSLLNSLHIVGIDCETSSLDIWSGEMITFQLGDEELQIVIDCSTVDLLQYKDYLESDRLFVIHNAKFDLKWLYRYHIVIRNIFDTYLSEKIRYLGYPPGQVSASLQSCCQRYLNVSLDKTITTTFTIHSLSTEQIHYAAEDVQYLPALMHKQQELLSKRQQLVAAQIEHSFVRVLAYVEYCGIKLDTQRWKEKIDHDLLRVQEAKAALDQWVLCWVQEHNKPILHNYDSSMRVADLIIKKGIYVVEEIPSLFSEMDSGLQCILDWNSPLQVIKLFKELGFDLTTKDRKTGQYRESVDLKIISKQAAKSSIVPLYIEYSKSFKVISAFGDNYLSAINKTTGRIHPQFNQLMDTGRISCGSKDGDSVNIQQLPNNEATRESFVAEEGNLLVDCDYHEQEGYVFAELSGDRAWINFYNDTNKRDGHGFVAKMCFPEELRDIPELAVKQQRNDLRALAKSARFCFNYNGSARTMADACGISVEQAEKIYKNYFEQFKGIAAYFKQQKKVLWERGYILINPLTGLRSWVYNYPLLKGIMDMQKTIPSFWERYKQAKNSGQVISIIPSQVVYKIAEKLSKGVSLEEIEGNYSYTATGGKEALMFINKDTALVQAMRYLWKEKAEWENSCCNYPTQGTSAAMTKIAMIKYFNHLIEEDRLFVIKIVNIIHDEALCEIPAELAVEEAQILSHCMQEAATIFCKKVTLSTDPLIDKVWKH